MWKVRTFWSPCTKLFYIVNWFTSALVAWLIRFSRRYKGGILTDIKGESFDNLKKKIIYETIYGHSRNLEQAHDRGVPGKFLLSRYTYAEYIHAVQKKKRLTGKRNRQKLIYTNITLMGVVMTERFPETDLQTFKNNFMLTTKQFQWK